MGEAQTAADNVGPDRTSCLFLVFNLFYLFINIIMIINFTKKFLFTSSKESQKLKELNSEIGGLNSLSINKRKMALQGFKQYEQTLPTEKLRTKFKDNLVELTLYMQHDCQKCQYLFSVLNYQKIGFKKVTDLAFLNLAEQSFGLKKVPENQKWPLIRFCYPLGEPVMLRGFEEVYPFLGKHNLLRFLIQPQENMSFAEQYIDNTIGPALESIFWHPTLTFQYSFHADMSSYVHNMANYMLLGILYRNIKLVTRRLFVNLKNIFQKRQQYLNSKKKLTDGLREMEKLLKDKQYFGGEVPHHLDFYLYSLLKSRWASRNFRYYIENQIGRQFWQWMLRMGSKTQYDKERITLID